MPWCTVLCFVVCNCLFLLYCALLCSHVQSKTGWGPRFFVPAVYLPQRYDYHRRFNVRNGRVNPDPDATAGHIVVTGAARTADAAAVNAGGAAPPGGTTRLGQAWASILLRAAVIRRNTLWFSMATRQLFAQWISPRPAMTQGRENRSWFHWWLRSNQPYARLDDANNGVVPEPVPGAVAEDRGADAALDGAENGIATTGGSSSSTDPSLDEVVGEAVGGGADGAAREAQSIDCVVCQEPVTLPIRRREYMLTPCDHLFHTGCLRPWLEQRLECPTCRMRLPEPPAVS